MIPIGEGELHLCHASLAMHPLPGPCPLSADEQARAARFRFARDQRRFKRGRGILRRLLAAYVGVPPEQIAFTLAPYGKPRLVEGDIHFNLSHVGERLLIAVTRSMPVGVDMERAWIDPALDAAIRALLAPEPCGASGTEMARAWVRHEARLKALGLGLGCPLPSLPSATLAEPPAPPGHVAAVVVLGPVRQIQCREWADGAATSAA